MQQKVKDAHLMVPVGDGQGLAAASWGSGMLIFSGGSGGFFLGVATATGWGGATASSIKD